MTASQMGAVPAERPQKQVEASRGPMSQQDAVGSHGHEMHPQKFVRLVGCHDLNAGKREAGRQLH